MTGPYHDHWIDGYHFIFLGTEVGLELFCSLSEAQLAWLDDKLSEEASSDKPVFLFLHQPLKDTVAGSLESQKWFGVTQDEELKAILAKYPQAILFTGHTHWELEAGHNYFDGAGKLPQCSMPPPSPISGQTRMSIRTAAKAIMSTYIRIACLYVEEIFNKELGLSRLAFK